MSKTRFEFTTNTIVSVVSAKDDDHCLAIREIANKLGERYRFVILTENESFDNFDRTAYPSSFVLCPKFYEDKTHYNWSRTKFDLYYVNTAKRKRKELVPGGTRQLLTVATPVKTQQMLTLLLMFSEIEETENMTYRRSGRSIDSTDSKDESKYFTTLRTNVTVRQMCRLLECIEAALDEEDMGKVREIMEQWEDHILEGS